MNELNTNWKAKIVRLAIEGGSNHTLSTRDVFQIQGRISVQVKIKEWGKIYQMNSDYKRARLARIVLDQKDITTKNITRDKEGHFKRM